MKRKEDKATVENYLNRRAEVKGIFARIPSELHDDIVAICVAEDLQMQEVLELALLKLVKSYVGHADKVQPMKKKKAA